MKYLLLLASFLALPGLVAAQGRQLAVAVAAGGSSPRSAVETHLPKDWPRLEQRPVFQDGNRVVWVTPPMGPEQSASLFPVVEALRQHVGGLLAAGELYRSTDRETVIYTGRARLHGPVGDYDAMTSWARERSLDIVRTDRAHSSVLLSVPLPPTDLIGLTASAADATHMLTPVLVRFHRVVPLPDEQIGGYHILPVQRTRLAFTLRKHSARSAVLDTLAEAGIVPLDADDPDGTDSIEFLRFDTERSMMAAMSLLLARTDLVDRVGPATSTSPPFILTAQLGVAFVDGASRDAAQPILNEFELEEAYPLPYFEHGYLFRRVVDGRPEPSFELYEAASRLLDERLAHVAVPDVASTMRPLFDEDCGALDCGADTRRAYLDAIHVEEAWHLTRIWGRRTVVGMLDEGFRNDLCSEVEVAAMADIKFNLAGETAAMPLCVPEDPGQWCGQCEHWGEEWANLSNTHAADAAAVLASKDGAPGSVCDSSIGVAPGARLINVRKTQVVDHWQVASALWWMAGGDPGVPELFPIQLDADRRATVINLALDTTSPHVDCPATRVVTDTVCAQICTSGTPVCDLVDAALSMLRRGENPAAGIREEGVLVVAAQRPDGTSQLSESLDTIAVGTVSADGLFSPENSSGHSFVPRDTVDLVAPMGDDNDVATYGNRRGGNTSLAATVVSGVAALLFDINPDLTAAQAQCILELTAQRELWGSQAPQYENCEFGPTLRSSCFGRGLVDACAAARMAWDCRPCTQLVIRIDADTGRRILAEAPCFSEPFAATALALPAALESRPGDCRCDRAGQIVGSLSVIAGELAEECIGCRSEAAGGPALPGDETPADERPPEAIDLEAHARIMALLSCINKGRCSCAPTEPDCLTVTFVNRFEARDDVIMEVCRSGVCRELSPHEGGWAAKDKISFALPFDRSFLDLWGNVGDDPPEIRLFAGDQRLGFDGSEFGRAVSEEPTLDKKRGGH